MPKRKARGSGNPWVKRARNAYQVGKVLHKGLKFARKVVKRPKATPRRPNSKGVNLGRIKAPIIESSGYPDKQMNVRIRYKAGKMGKMMKLIGNRSVSDDVTIGSSVSSLGIQNANNYAVQLTGAKIIEMYERAAYQWNDVTGTAIELDNFKVATRSMKFMVSSMRSELRLQNQSPSSVECDIYVLICKRSAKTLEDPEASWNSDLQQAAGQPTNVVSTTQAYARPGGPHFNRSFWVKKKYSVVLGQGCTHHLNFNHQVNRVVDIGYVTEYAQIKGITSWVLVVQRGVLADSTQSYTLSADITLTSTKLIAVMKTRTVGQLVNFWPRHHTQNSNLGTENTTAFIQNMDSGGVTDTLVTTNIA